MRLFPKLSLAFSGLLIGAIVCLSGSFYWAEQRSIRAEANAEQQAILQNLVHIAQESYLTNDDLLLVKYTHWLSKWNPEMISARVVDTQGQVIAHSEPDRIGKPMGLDDPQTARAEVLVLSAPVRMGAHGIANASVTFSQRSLEETIHRRLAQLQRRLIEVSSVSLIVGLIVCFSLALSWTRPIGLLAKMAERIGQGRWDLDLGAVELRHDELGFLSRCFHKMADQLRELDEMKEDFVSAVTHELRSPLGAIESYLNLIGEELHQGISLPDWENYLHRLRLNTQRLTRFVNDLLDVAALTRGAITLERRPADVPALVRDVLDLFAVKLREKHLKYEVQVSPLMPPALCDAERVHQVIVNLVTNAIKFTPEKGHILIQVDSLLTKKLLQVSVTDTGIGISTEDQAKIFNKFQQVRSARQTVKGPKGTGLGLVISRALIEMHGGTLSVRSQPGKGSTFYFTLPLAEAGVASQASKVANKT